MRCLILLILTALALHNVRLSKAEITPISRNQGSCNEDTKIGLLSIALIVIIIILILLILILLYIAWKQQKIIEQTKNTVRKRPLFLPSIADHPNHEMISMEPTISKANTDDTCEPTDHDTQSYIPEEQFNDNQPLSYDINPDYGSDAAGQDTSDRRSPTAKTDKTSESEANLVIACL